jgi:hypothetical protein
MVMQNDKGLIGPSDMQDTKIQIKNAQGNPQPDTTSEDRDVTPE